MGWATFIQLLDWVDRATTKQHAIHFMGGEPTLHPDFLQMIEAVNNRGRRLVVFSNLTAPLEERILQLARLPDCLWVVNINEPLSYAQEHYTRLLDNLERLGDSALLCYNVYRLNQSYDHLFEMYRRFGLRMELKVGVALPVALGNNAHIASKKTPELAEYLVQLVGNARDLGLRVEFECGVSPCLFNSEQRERLGDLKISHCGSRLDITPNGTVVNCLPLSELFEIPHECFTSYAEALEWFKRARDPYMNIGPSPDCLDCDLRRQAACSACLAHVVKDFDRLALPPLPRSTDNAVFTVSIG